MEQGALRRGDVLRRVVFGFHAHETRVLGSRVRHERRGNAENSRDLRATVSVRSEAIIRLNGDYIGDYVGDSFIETFQFTGSILCGELLDRKVSQRYYFEPFSADICDLQIVQRRIRRFAADISLAYDNLRV